MGIFLAVLIIEVAIVSTCRHRLVGDIERGLQFLVHVQRIVGRLRNADLPRHTLVVDATRHNLSSYLHHIVLYSL